MDKMAKALMKLSEKERKILVSILKKIKNNSFSAIDLKKLKGRKDIYRARKGKFRIIFLKNKKEIRILSLERRSETTY